MHHELGVRVQREIAVAVPTGILIGIEGTILAEHQETLLVHVGVGDRPLRHSEPES